MKTYNVSTASQPRKAGGFTLVELLFAVFFIFAALAAIVVTTGNVTATGKHNAAVAEIRTLVQGARAWKSQPARAGQGDYTGLLIQNVNTAGIDIAPFRTDGGLSPTYQRPTYLRKAAGAGFQVIYGTDVNDESDCYALLEPFSSDSTVTAASNCETTGWLYLIYSR